MICRTCLGIQFSGIYVLDKIKMGHLISHEKNKHIQSQLVQEEPYGAENCNIVSFHRDLQGFTISTGDIQQAQCAGDTYLSVAQFW